MPPSPLHPDDLRPAEALLVVPPFARLDLPGIGVHLLQACARERGHEVAVLYAGAGLAAEIGEPLYHALSELLTPWMLAERLFARPAHGLPRLGRGAEAALAGVVLEPGNGARRCRIDLPALRALAERLERWVEQVAAAIAAGGYRFVGCATVFEQTNVSLALLKEVKRLRPETITLLGGANCFGEMARGLAGAAPWVDHLFDGESERAFPSLLADPTGAPRVIAGAPWQEMDALPVPDYGDYLAQLRRHLGPEVLPDDALQLPFEGSRGCWWGQKHHCTFCGVAEMRYRQKSPDRAIDELRAQLAGWPSRRVHTVDDIMPHAWFRALLPRLGQEIPGLKMSYEQKANLSLERVVALKAAGIHLIQPGVEALSTPLLRRMDKGTTARQNVALLRYARSARLRLVWNLLYGFPGDEPGDYEPTLALLPLLGHLNPPQFAIQVLLVRFSPYWRDPAGHGIQDLRPARSYADVLPEGADLPAIAYYFDGDYGTAADRDPAQRLRLIDGVAGWRDAWAAGAPPELSVRHLGGPIYLLTDTRGLPGTIPSRPVSREMAAAALVARPLSDPGPLAAAIRMEQEMKTCLPLGGWSVPLATAEPALLAQFERDFGTRPARGPAARAAAAPAP